MRHRRIVDVRSVLGIVVMVLGLQLVVAASAGAAPDSGEHKVTICHRTNAVTNPYVQITVDYDAADGATGKGNNDHTHHLGPVFDFAADPAVAYPTPRNGDQWGDIIPPYEYDGGTFPGVNWTLEGGEPDTVAQAIWNAGCKAPDQEEPEDTTLQIVKEVDGADAPGEWSFPFTGLAGGFVLTDEAPGTDPEIIDPDTPYVVTETDTGGANATAVSCEGGEAVVDGASVTVVVAQGGAAICTFRNTFVDAVVEEATGSITVTKEVTGDAPDTWSFPFDGGALGSFPLSEADASETFGELDEGVYVITETDAGEAGLAGIDCGDADVVVAVDEDAGGGSVTVTLAQGEDVECTFTNDFGEVQDNTVRTPPKTDEVLGSVVQATLPRTGAGSAALAAVGALLLAAGAVLTFGARHLEVGSADRREP